MLSLNQRQCWEQVQVRPCLLLNRQALDSLQDRLARAMAGLEERVQLFLAAQSLNHFRKAHWEINEQRRHSLCVGGENQQALNHQAPQQGYVISHCWLKSVSKGKLVGDQPPGSVGT